MNNEQAPINCPYCQSPVNNIPAGVSKKSGKPYDEFWACKNRDCKFTWKPDKNTSFKPFNSKQKPPTEKQTLNEIDQGKQILKAITESEDRIMGALREIYKKLEEEKTVDM